MSVPQTKYEAGNAMNNTKFSKASDEDGFSAELQKCTEVKEDLSKIYIIAFKNNQKEINVEVSNLQPILKANKKKFPLENLRPTNLPNNTGKVFSLISHHCFRLVISQAELLFISH